MKVDIKDRRILYELDKNSRASYTKIAKAVGMPQESVRYRIQNLTKRKIINKFFTVIDSGKLGYVFYKVLLRLHNINEQRKKEIVEYLRHSNIVVWLVDFEGDYDIGFVVKATNIIELSNLMDDLKTAYGAYIKRVLFSINIAGEYLTRGYLIGKEREAAKQVSYSANLAHCSLDKVNIGIIRVLTDNARTPAIEIANRLDISSDAVIQRLRKLERDKVIRRYTLVLNHSNINQLHYKILIYLNNVPPDEIKGFITYCRAQSKIVYMIKCLGEWDYELDLEVENTAELRKILMKLTEKFYAIIEDYKALLINEIYKYNLYP